MKLVHFGKLRGNQYIHQLRQTCNYLFADVSERIDPEYAGFGVRPTGRKPKKGGSRSKVGKHAAVHKRDTFEDISEEVK